MNFIKFAIIAGAHLVALAIVYLLSTVGGEDDGTATAGANGLVTWSNQEANADRQIVDSSSGLPFDSRSGDLNGYNAGDRQAPTMLAQNSTVNRRRQEPTRPTQSSSGGSSSSDDVLLPLSKPVTQSYPQPSRSVPASPLPQFIEYTVVSGDSLWAISKKSNNVTVDEIRFANPSLRGNNLRVGEKLRIPRKGNSQIGSSASSATTAASSAPKDPGTIYTVKPGDSLGKIAGRQGTTVPALKAANGLRSDLIRVGQTLTIPNAVKNSSLASQQWTGRKVVVKPGDSLSKIAAIYSSDAKAIMRLNNISNEGLIRIGQTILIPESSSGAASSPVPTPRNPVVENQAESRSSMIMEDPQPAAPQETLLDIEEEGSLLIEEDLVEEPLIQIED